MNTFLHSTALKLQQEFGTSLPHCQIVFASRRAKIYFDEIIPNLQTTTIDHWIIGNAQEKVEIPSKFALIHKLYKIYDSVHSGHSFESFYDFGAMLLSDFDTIDRYMVDAQRLYANLSDIKDIEQLFSADDPTFQAALSFWQSFRGGENGGAAQMEIEQRFLEIWQSLYGIYSSFREGLSAENSAYQGMAYRAIAEGFDPEKVKHPHTVFIGLNALSNSERSIFRSLIVAGKASFVWDYDTEWLGDPFIEAGYFIGRNVSEFSEIAQCETAPSPPEINIIPVPLETMQCKVVGEMLSGSLARGESLDNTAIVLTDENLLFPLLGSLPEGVGAVNISMGYPLLSSSAGRLVQLLVDLCGGYSATSGSFSRSSVQNLLMHQYFVGSGAIIESLKSFKQSRITLSGLEGFVDDFPHGYLFSLCEGNRGGGFELHRYIQSVVEELCVRYSDQPEELEFLRLLGQSLEEVLPLLGEYGEELSGKLYLRLLRQSMGDKRLDFQGISGRGLQIMGILESRALDFQRVILLSLGDDNFPSSKPDKSYIPQALLTGFGMPNQQERSAIWSYYFYRLLLRSGRVDLLYCDVADNLKTGEPSRYIQQLQYGGRYMTRTITPRLPELMSRQERGFEVVKTLGDITKIKGLRYSPSSLSVYLTCPLKFYFKHIAGMKEPVRVVGDGELGAADKGTLVHKALQGLYTGLTTPPFHTKLSGISDKDIEGAVMNVLVELVGEELKVDSASTGILLREAVGMVQNTLEYDKGVGDIERVEGLEKRCRVVVSGADGTQYSVGGDVDRVDVIRGGGLRVIDYKTGGKVEFNVPSIPAAFGVGEGVDTSKDRSKYKEIRQLLIYCLSLREKHDTIPAIYTPRTIGADSPQTPITIGARNQKRVIDRPLSVEDYQQIEGSLVALLEEISNPTVPFTQNYNTEEFGNCSYCSFLPICSGRR